MTMRPHLPQVAALCTSLILVSLAARAKAGNHRAGGPKMAIQFFGDLFIPTRSLKLTGSSATEPKLFQKLRPLMASSAINIVNFEGAITPHSQPHTLKSYLLPMPASVAPLIKKAGVAGVTLANNHALDYGLPGMLATIDELERAKIPATGVGLNLEEALRPMVFPTAAGNFCVFSISKTYPQEFWATPARFGTASPSIRQLTGAIKNARPICRKIFAVFHWGAEGRKTAKGYQRTLARRAIDAGAAAVFGHHPHVLQSIELYKGRPILYSLGNFLFGTLPLSSTPEGMAAGLTWRKDGKTELWLTPLRVNNKQVKFITTPLTTEHLAAGEDDPVGPLVGTWTNCHKSYQTLNKSGPAILRWRCVF